MSTGSVSSRIGYAARDDRLAARAHALILGVVLFLASEVMFFAAIFAAYYDLRGRAQQWPPPGVHLAPLEPTIGTVLLALSDACAMFALAAIRRGRSGIARRWLFATLALGIVFLSLTFHEWAGNSFTLASHAYGSVHYAMTGFHAAHVTAGLVLIAFLAVGAREPAFRGAGAAGAEAIGYYWHFVFVVWLGIWATIWLVR